MTNHFRSGPAASTASKDAALEERRVEEDDRCVKPKQQQAGNGGGILMTVGGVQPGKSRRLTQDFDLRPRHKPDESQKRQDHRNENALNGADRRHAERRHQRERQFPPIDLIKDLERLEVQQRKSRLDEHGAQSRDRHVLQRTRKEEQNGRDG